MYVLIKWLYEMHSTTMKIHVLFFLSICKWSGEWFVYFFTVYQKLQLLHEKGVSNEDWEIMNKMVGEGKAHLVWQLILADGIYCQESS